MVHLSCLYCGSNELVEKKSSIKDTKRLCCNSCGQEFVIRGVLANDGAEKRIDLLEHFEEVVCVHCGTNKVQKNGILKGGGQRYKCLCCARHFTKGGIRGTYDEEFKQKIADYYVNRKISARKLARKYNISTSTIVTWGKMFKKGSRMKGT